MRLRRAATTVSLLLAAGGLPVATAHAATTLPVQLTATAQGGLGVTVTDADAVAGDTFTFKWGGDTSSTTTSTGSATHSYYGPGTYTISETVTDAAGDSGSATTSFTTAGSVFQPTAPTRILDTRKGVGAPTAKVAAGGVVRLKVAGVAGIPTANVTAVTLNLTAVNGTLGGGYITAYADQSAEPGVSNLNYGTSAAVANSVVVQVGADGYIDLQNTTGNPASSVDLIADVSGYYVDTMNYGVPYGYQPVDPARMLDTRIGTGAPKAAVGAYKSVSLKVTGYAYSYNNGYVAISTGYAAAVVVHVTVTNAKSGGYITAYSDDASLPNASTLNYSAGQTISNTVIVPCWDGSIKLYNSSPGTVDLIADDTGFYYQDGYTYIPVTPQRLLDTRKTHSLSNGQFADASTAIDPQISPNAVALATNLTATQATGSGHLTAQATTYDTSSVNYGPGQTVANFTQVTDSGGNLYVTNVEGQGTVAAIVDAFGYFITPYNPYSA